MVLDDFFTESRENGRTRKLVQARTLDAQLASPIDRLAANIADLVLILPILALVMSPFSRRAKEAQLLGADDAWTLAVVSGVFAAFFALIVYQTIFVALYGATPGKIALRLRVVSVWGMARPRPIEAFIRALVWSLEVAVLGAPFLGVFSNLKRRPFHDRASDTAVIALARSRQSGLSSLPEMSVASGFQSAVLAVVTLTVAINFTEYRKHHDTLQAAIVSREDEGRLCPEVREALQESGTASKRTASLAERLEVSLALFNTGVIDRECLDGEAELAFWRNREPALAYLAKGLALSDHQIDKSETYFDKACDSDRPEKGGVRNICRMAALARVSHDSRNPVAHHSRIDDDDDEADAKVALLKREADAEAALAAVSVDSPSYLKSAAIQQILAGDRHPERLARVVQLIDSYHGPRRAGAFVTKARVQALWSLGLKSDAMIAMRSASILVDPGARIELARWFCSAETEIGSCGTRSRGVCGELVSAVDKSEGWLVKPDVAVAYIRGALCEPGTDIRALKEKMPLEDGKSYLEALALLKENKADDAVQELESIVEDNSESRGEFYLEASLKLTDLAASPKQLVGLAEAWRGLEPTDAGFRPLGRRLLAKFTQLQSWNDAVAIGLKLTKFDSGDRQVFETLAFAANSAGQRKLAAGMMQNAMRLDPIRRPASLSEPRLSKAQGEP